MYIKNIKLHGFKSFADKIDIELDQFFTGIVGPNGSGKSNIVDAIKWVLGEQSVKTLRGSNNMTDVIFSGSSSRPAANYAAVTLVFDNSDRTLNIDFNEVSVKRIVYKSGENEYYLNQERCRLKDITDLFMDSRSSKESFNIVPQNKIDQILSEKPEERRVIFEDAAGVLKYKRRKEESLSKLSKTHDNIERIIKRAAGEGNENKYENITYEGYGPCGVAVIVEALTDNRNRTAGDLRHYFDKFGGNMGTPGCVSFMFTQKGVIAILKEDIVEDVMMEDALEAGADDFVADEEIFTIYTDPSSFSSVREALEGKGYNFVSAEVEMVPSTYTKIEDEETLAKMYKLLDVLEDNDDVQNVWHNLDE